MVVTESKKMNFPKIRYVRKTLHHKWFVFWFGLRTKAPIWRLLIHDWTKFTPAELPAYANRFFGDGNDHISFALAWNHHSKLNPHHWEFWVPLTAHSKSPIPGGQPLPMAEWAVREMVADWLGAERSYNGFTPKNLSTWKWYNDNRGEMQFHPETALLLDDVLAKYFEAFGG